MAWRRSGVGLAAVLILISMGAFTAVAVSDGGRSGGMKQFNACITGSGFLVPSRVTGVGASWWRRSKIGHVATSSVR